MMTSIATNSIPASSRSLSSTSSSSSTTTVRKRRRVVIAALWVLTGLVLVRLTDEKFASWVPESINTGKRRTDSYIHLVDNDVVELSMTGVDNLHLPVDLRPVEKQPNDTAFALAASQEQQSTKKGHAIVDGNHPSRVASFEPNKTRSIVFVHVGKNGGNTMRLAFPRLKCRRVPGGMVPKMRCFKRTFRPESPLAHQLNIEMHMQQIGPNVESLEKDYNTFLYALRNPVTRAISAYQYLHHNNTHSVYAQKKHPLKDKFYKKCFPTLQDLLETLVEMEDNHNNSIATTNNNSDTRPNREKVAEKHSNLKHPRHCQRMAMNALKGNNPRVKHINVHLRDNYQFYYERTIQPFPDKEVLVVRTEKLWEDIKELDRKIGGPGVFENEGNVANKNPLNKNHTASTSIRATQISETKQHQLRNLCCILVDEMKIFQKILNRAVNFSYRNKLETMQDVWASCGIDSHQIIQYQKHQQRISTDGTKDEDITIASTQPIIQFSWSKWHQERCPELALRSS